jgi:hypothetical protein
MGRHRSLQRSGNRQSAIGNRQSAIGNRQSAIGNRQSAIGNRMIKLDRVGSDPAPDAYSE